MANVADVIAPANDEGTKAILLKWCKSVGDTVAKDEPLVELETDKVTVEISSPASGRLTEIFKRSDQEVTPGDLLGRISGEADGAAVGEALPVDEAPMGEALTMDGPLPVHGTPAGATAAPASDGKRSLSPSVRRLLAEHDLTPNDVIGSGRKGRITAQDVTRRAERGSARTAAVAQLAKPAGGATRVPHTPIRRRIAEHMARSLLEAPHVTTLFEADLTKVLAHRARHAADFDSRGGRLTLTAYFISACARALRAIPEVNATFHEDALELHPDANIGIGTALGNNGLIVPVIHRAQELNLFGVAQRLNRVVEHARAGKLAPDDVRGGTFTISNHGVGGSLLAAPIIINQPQVAILGVGKLQRRVCAVMADGVESIGVRSMCYLTLSIDHRALDAFQANAFLSLVVKTLEQWSENDV
jgi:2-oxoglutarate dehydrogenase E2 component (dihydrolipoamide succinyltransferase)